MSETAEPTVTLQVPQEDGTVATFDGVQRAWDVVSHLVEVAVSDVEHFLRNVPGATVPTNPESATSSDSKAGSNPEPPAPPSGANPAPREG